MTPGPNNLMVMVSGAAFGMRATLPHIARIALGVAIDESTTTSNVFLHISIFRVFIVLTTAGYRIWYWVTCLGLVLHAALDLVIHYRPTDPSPDWCGLFCLSLDLVLAASMIWLRPDARFQQRRD